MAYTHGVVLVKWHTHIKWSLLNGIHTWSGACQTAHRGITHDIHYPQLVGIVFYHMLRCEAQGCILWRRLQVPPERFVGMHQVYTLPVHCVNVKALLRERCSCHLKQSSWLFLHTTYISKFCEIFESCCS